MLCRLVATIFEAIGCEAGSAPLVAATLATPDSGSKGRENEHRTEQRGARHHVLRCTTWSKGRRSGFSIGLRGRSAG